MKDNKDQLIFALYKTDDGAVHLGLSSEFKSFQNKDSYFIDLNNSLLKITMENIDLMQTKGGDNFNEMD